MATAVAELFQSYGAMMVALVVVALSLVYWLVVRRLSYGTSVLICGLSDSGKTTLFSWLVLKKHKATVTSQTTNKGSADLGDKRVTLIDIPGHDRIRQRCLDEHKADALAVLFVVDSSTIQRQIKDVAEAIYEILAEFSDGKRIKRMMVLCNKQDLPLPKSAKAVHSLLEKELTVVCRTKAAALSGEERKSLMKTSDDFAFGSISFEIDFAETSLVPLEDDSAALPPSLKTILTWLKACV